VEDFISQFEDQVVTLMESMVLTQLFVLYHHCGYRGIELMRRVFENFTKEGAIYESDFEDLLHSMRYFIFQEGRNVCSRLGELFISLLKTKNEEVPNFEFIKIYVESEEISGEYHAVAIFKLL